jgi:hypothetical protein
MTKWLLHEQMARNPPCSANHYSRQLLPFEVLNIRVGQQTGLLVDVTLRHDFIGAGRDGGENPRQAMQPRQPGSDPRERRCPTDS